MDKNGILLSHKMNEILPYAVTRMDLENIILNKGSQTAKDKYCMISIICNDISYLQSLKNNTNESIYKTEIESQI